MRKSSFRGRIARSAAAVLLVASTACSKGTTPPGPPAAAPPDAPVLELLKDAPPLGDFSVTDLDGKTITSAALRGKVVLVNFWATWCPPCREEIPSFIALQEKYRNDVVILGISEDEGPIEAVRAFVAEHKINYFIGMTTPALSKVFRGVAALPTTFVIDREGKLAQRHTGLVSAELVELEAQVLAGLNTNVRVERVDDPAKARLEHAAQATSIPGIDLTKLTPAQRTEAIKALNADDCTCGCTLTLAECRINDPSCDISLPLAKAKVEKIAAAAGAAPASAP